MSKPRNDREQGLTVRPLSKNPSTSGFSQECAPVWSRSPGAAERRRRIPAALARPVSGHGGRGFAWLRGNQPRRTSACSPCDLKGTKCRCRMRSSTSIGSDIVDHRQYLSRRVLAEAWRMKVRHSNETASFELPAVTTL